ncbi:peptidase T [Spirochaetia bacterium]|nr:peptidase T [Spirochaetia bacterium]
MNTAIINEDKKVFTRLTTARFLKYVSFNTISDRHQEATPSTQCQWDLARYLVEELKTLGLKDIELTDHCYVIARLPASPGKEAVPALGFLAHLDTSSEVSGENIKAVIVENYDGKPIVLGPGLSLDPGTDPDLAAQKGKALIHTDGSTLLGGDDKAGIAAVVGAVEYLLKRPEISHGTVELIFTPDEETGKGLPEFPLAKLKSKACFTLDGGPIGELEIECFNAWGANIKFTGKSMHLGTARGIMANAASMAASFAAMLPRSESPEATDGYYGYYCPLEIHGDIENATLEVFIRDFDRKGAEKRVAALDVFARAVEAQFPGGKVTVEAKAQYFNMKEKINEKPEVFEKVKTAFNNLGIEIHQKPIRGGTDGSRLTELGIPTPNIFTGGRNAHSRLEWVSIPELAAASQLTAELIRLWAED